VRGMATERCGDHASSALQWPWESPDGLLWNVTSPALSTIALLAEPDQLAIATDGRIACWACGELVCYDLVGNEVLRIDDFKDLRCRSPSLSFAADGRLAFGAYPESRRGRKLSVVAIYDSAYTELWRKTPDLEMDNMHFVIDARFACAAFSLSHRSTVYVN
jgi:hypothetical protein